MTQTAAAKTFDQERAEQAAKSAEQLAVAKKRLAELEAQTIEAAKLVQTLIKKNNEATRVVPTQERIKLAFAALRKQGYHAKMTMDDDETWEGPTCCLGIKTFWFDGEPTRLDPNRQAHPQIHQLIIQHRGTPNQIQGALAVLRHFGVAAAWSGMEFDNIVVEPRVLTCQVCKGSGKDYNAHAKFGSCYFDCATCAKTGLVPNPAGTPSVVQ